MSPSVSGSPAPGSPPSTGTPPPGSPPAPAAASKFLYIGGGAKGQDGFIASYSINPQTVAITPTPNSFRFQPSGDDMVRSPQDSSFYGSSRSQEVIGYIPSATDGTAQTVSTVPFDSFSLTISPDGRFVFATGGSAIGVFSASQGHLAPVAGSPFNPESSGTDLIDVAVSPNGRFLFARGFTGVFPNAVSHIFSLAIGSDGKLTPVNNVQAGGPIVVDKSGRFLYAPESPQGGKPVIHVYSIDQATGALSEGAGSPFPFISLHPDPNALAFPIFMGPDNLLYVLATSQNQVLAFSLNSSNGQPVQVGSSPVRLPFYLSFDRNGHVAYMLFATDTKTVVGAFSIGANGVLTPITGSQADAEFGSDVAPRVVLAD